MKHGEFDSSFNLVNYVKNDEEIKFSVHMVS